MEKKKKTFKEAVEATASVSKCFKAGLQALEKDHSKKIKADTRRLHGSLFIDECMKKIDDGNRWDYAIGYNNEAYFVEVHSATTNEVSTMMKKLAWLQDWLNHSAIELNKIKANDCFHWIQSGRFDILKQSRQYKTAQQSGIFPKPFLQLN